MGESALYRSEGLPWGLPTDVIALHSRMIPKRLDRERLDGRNIQDMLRYYEIIHNRGTRYLLLLCLEKY